MARGTMQERGSDSPPVRVPAPDPHQVMLIQGPVPELHPLTRCGADWGNCHAMGVGEIRIPVLSEFTDDVDRSVVVGICQQHIEALARGEEIELWP